MKKLCPCCNKELVLPEVLSGEDIGNLFSCDHCQSVLKWEEGELKVIHQSKEEPPAEEASESPGFEDTPPENKEEPASPEEEAFLNPSGEALEPEQEEAPVEQMSEEQKAEETGGEETEEPSEEKALREEALEPDFNEQEFLEGEENVSEESPSHQEASFGEAEEFQSEGGEETGEEQNAISEESPAPEVHQDFSDVEEYGNAQATSEKGFLRYDICLSGLDSVEIENQVKAVLEDPRFKWDVNEILASQNQGFLVIKNLNPIKAVCLISELSFLSVKLSWKQYMALDVESEEKSEEVEETE